MHNSYFVFLVISMVLTSVVDSVFNEIKMAQTPSFLRSSSAIPNEIPTPTQLISATDNDERGISSFISRLVTKKPTMEELLAQDISAHYVMTKLKFDPYFQKNFGNSKLQTLSDYVDMFNKKNPNRKTSLIDTLRKEYSEHYLVLDFQIAKNKGNEVTKAMATKLQTELFEHWVKNKKTASDVFNDLGFQFYFDNTRLTILDDYVKVLNAKNPHDNTKTLKVLIDGFEGEDKLALRLALNVPDGNLNIWNLLFQEWVKRELNPMSVLVDVFKVDEKKLNDASDKIKAIIAEYKPFYLVQNKRVDPDWVPKNVDPRRL